MHSSTSNSESPAARPERATIALLLAALVTLLLGATWPRDEVGVFQDAFWHRKVTWSGVADVVVAGDSRVYRGVSPSEMTEVLGGARIVNYGFSSNGYSQTYLQSLASILDPESEDRIIVLGITPFSLTDRAVDRNDFNRFHSSTATRRWAAEHLAPIHRLCTPIGFAALAKRAKGMRYFEKFTDDGWVASRQVPENPRKAIAPYRAQFAATQVGEEHIQRVFDAVEEFVGAGVTVFALRPPSSGDMVALEDELTTYDTERIARGIRAAGGIWIDFPQDAYPTYDGSHLREDGARRFSRDLALAIREAHQAGGGTLARPTPTGARRRRSYPTGW